MAAARWDCAPTSCHVGGVSCIFTVNSGTSLSAVLTALSPAVTIVRMKLITASLKYFRGITDKTFTPAIDGITAIVGENGTGKTSILAGISWCLYGEKPEGVKRADALINEKADYKAGDRTQVTCVIIAGDGRLLRVNRRITTRKGATEVDM